MQTSLLPVMPLSSHKEINSHFQQELQVPPPPYKSELNDECLPRYMESSSSMDLSSMMDRFAPRWDNQRVEHHYNSDDKKRKSSTDRMTDDQTGQLLDRMEEYRHTDQEWMSLNQTRMNHVLQNMYHMHHPKKQQPLCLSSAAKSTYQKMTLSIAKEREQIKKNAITIIKSHHLFFL